MTDKMRESFEAWFTSKRGAGMLSKLFGGYEWIATSEAWEVWQAATALERERCAKVCEAEAEIQKASAKFCKVVNLDTRDFIICAAAISGWDFVTPVARANRRAVSTRSNSPLSDKGVTHDIDSQTSGPRAGIVSKKVV